MSLRSLVCYNSFVLRLRVLTAAVGLPLVILSLLLGQYSFGLFLGVVAAVCTVELCHLAPGLPRWDALVLSAAAFSVLLAVARVVPNAVDIVTLLVSAVVILSLLMLLDTSPNRRTFAQWSWAIAGALYVGWLLGHWGGLYVLPAGRNLVIFGMLTTFSYDTFAFFTGRAIGRHKLAPRLSAGKTWEGAVGGLVMTVALSLAIRWVLLTSGGGFPLSSSTTMAVAVLVGFAAQLGDLVESALKRTAGAKDAGAILPGHGGMLDRFDSLLFTGPLLYYLAVWVIA